MKPGRPEMQNFKNDLSRVGKTLTSLMILTSISMTVTSHAAPSGFAARKPSPVKSVDYTCISCNIDAFVAHCDKFGGGLSTNPDGTTTCSIQSNKGTERTISSEIVALDKKRATGPRSLKSKNRGEAEGTIYRCESDNDFCATVFVKVCEEGGGGASSDPDGGVICTTD